MNGKARKPPMPEEVRRYLMGNVPSVPYLEAVLLLRADPAAHWDTATLAKRLYVTQSEAAGLVAALQAAQVAIARETGFQFTDDPELRHLLDAVALAYGANLREVADLIHAKMDRRARMFADAFKLRKD